MSTSHTKRCDACGRYFSMTGYTSHLLQTRNPACIKECQKQLGERVLDAVYEDGAEAEDHPHPFQGDFFGDDYSPADFGVGEEEWGRNGEDGDGGEDTQGTDGDGDRQAGGCDDDASVNDEYLDEDGYTSSDTDLDSTDADSMDDDDGELPASPQPPSPSPSPSPEERSNDESFFHGRLLTPEEYAHLQEILFDPAYVEMFPGGRAGEPIPGQQPSQYDRFRDHFDRAAPGNLWAPFRSELDWRIAQWAKLRGPTSSAFSDLLSIDGVVDHLGLSYKNGRELNKLVDEGLPGRPPFQREEVVVGGQAFDFYYRDIIECIKALFGNPEFQPWLVFAPERHFSDVDHTVRLFHDMHTGKWWWATQVCFFLSSSTSH
ncbi:hypothetical protein OF83DRAFT_239726 [Amylostereum chailletii]|nr:hypothetical protein OF83DRAFT_239726 [Amylostereum chailletii]